MAADVQKEDTAHFRIGGTSFTLAIPEGYCVPEGRQADIAQVLAAGDNLNVTNLTLLACTNGKFTDSDTDYILIKTPKPAILLDIGKEMLFESVRTEFESAAFSKAMADGAYDKDAEEGLAKVLGSNVDIETDFKPLGIDKDCAYLGGSADVAGGSVKYRISMGACLTSISNRVMTIYQYGPDKGAAGVADLIVKARKIALSLLRE
jgi:hypothetical protein